MKYILRFLTEQDGILTQLGKDQLSGYQLELGYGDEVRFETDSPLLRVGSLPHTSQTENPWQPGEQAILAQMLLVSPEDWEKLKAKDTISVRFLRKDASI